MDDITITDSAHPSHMVEELVAMRKAGELFDYVIKGSQESFNIHSLVFATMSPVFKAMLRLDMGESANKEATFPSIPDDILARVIDYAYNGTCKFSKGQLMELIKAAHYLQMPKLLKLCEDNITSVLKPSNAFSWLRVADRLQLKIGLPVVQNMMRDAFSEVIETDEFRAVELHELKEYVKDVREYGTCADDVLNGVLQWIKNDAVSRSTHMSELFGMIPVRKCTDEFLSKMIGDYAELLDGQQDMYKLMLSDMLKRSMSKVIGKEKTVIILGGQSKTQIPNSECWALQDEQMIKYCDSKPNGIKPYHSVCQIPGGMMLTGGRTTDMCTIFFLVNKMWIKQQALLSCREQHGSGYNKGKVFVISGFVSGKDLESKSVDYMELEMSIWRKGPPIPKAGYFLKVVSFQSALFVMFSKECSMYKLDCDTMCWSTVSSLPVSSYGCSLAASDSKIFAAGGNSNINYMYTPVTDAWCRLTGPSLVERQGAMIHHQQKLYLFGGCVRDNQLTDVEEYDISNDRWSLTKWKLPTPLIIFGAFLIDPPQ